MVDKVNIKTEKVDNVNCILAAIIYLDCFQKNINTSYKTFKFIFPFKVQSLYEYIDF